MKEKLREGMDRVAAAMTKPLQKKPPRKREEPIPEDKTLE